MKISEMKRDIGVTYDGDTARSELEQMYAEVDLETLEKVAKGRVQNLKDAQQSLRLLKSTHAPFSQTNSAAAKQLLTLYENILKAEMTALSDIWRKRKHATN